MSLDPQWALHAIGMIAARSGTSGPLRTVDGILDLLVERCQFDDVVRPVTVNRPATPSSTERQPRANTADARRVTQLNFLGQT
jgi:hypothetical protein